jgi:FlaA1/EpsC-like NDP-sugar epimerase
MALMKQLLPLTGAANRRRTAGLIVGDACMFLLFSAVGRASHHEAAGLDAFLLVVQTAAPFAIGWFVVAPFFGVYRASVTASARSMLGRTALAWVCAWPVGLLLRWLFTQQAPPVSFALVVLVANLLFLSIWRGVFALVVNRSR